MNDDVCDAKIRPMPNDTEISCELALLDHSIHIGTLRDYAYPGSATEISWAEDDRRNFHGEWPGRCNFLGCVLPKGHRGKHAT